MVYYLRCSFHLTQYSYIVFSITSVWFPFYSLLNCVGLDQLFFLLYSSSNYGCYNVQIIIILGHVVKWQAGILIIRIKRRTDASESSAR